MHKLLLRCAAFFTLISTVALAAAPTWTIVNLGLDDTFGTLNKGVVDPQVAGFTGIAYGNGIWVALGNSSRQPGLHWLTSPDGTTWTPRSQALASGSQTAGASKVHFLNGQFVFFATLSDGGFANTYVYTSTDGLTWKQTKVSNGATGVTEFDASPSLTVAAGDNAAQIYSSDLATWKSGPVVSGGGLYSHNDLAYGNGHFVSTINGFGGQAYTSTDGATWTPINGLATPGGFYIEYGNGVFLTSSGDTFWRSTDGVTFTKYTTTHPDLRFPSAGSMRFAGGRFLCQAGDLTGRSGYIASTDGVTWTDFGLIDKAPPPPAGQISRGYTFVDLAYGNGKYILVGLDVYQAAFSKTTLPLMIVADAEAESGTPDGGGSSAPVSQAVTAGSTATFITSATDTIQWQLNGLNLAGAVSATLSIPNVQPSSAGIYTAVITNSGVTTTQSAILGVSTASKIIGSGAELAPNITHPNGKIYDPLSLTGAAATLTADTGQATRISYIDLNDDIVQVEFAGAGTLSLVLDAATGPAAPTKYNQPAAAYMKGHAGIVITGADETTNLTIFSVGRLTAFDPTGTYDIAKPVSSTNNPANTGSPLFQGHAGTSYDGVADVAFVAIQSANGKFGGIRAANAGFFAASGFTGVYAPGVAFSGPLYIHDVNASDTATPVLLVGSVSDARITGGALKQANNKSVQISGITQLKFTDGTDSNNVTLSAQTNQAKLEQDGTDTTSQIVVNPATTTGSSGGNELTFFASGFNPPYEMNAKKAFEVSTTTLKFDSTALTNPVLATQTGGFTSATFTDPATGLVWSVSFKDGVLFEINISRNGVFVGQWN